MAPIAQHRLATVADVRRELHDKPLLGSSRGRTWQGLAVDMFAGYPAIDMVAGPRDHHILSVNLTASPRIRQQRCGSVFESAGLVGESSIIPAGVASRWDGDLPAHISLRFPTSALADTAYDLGRGRYPPVDLINGFRLRDPFIGYLASLFTLELKREAHPAQDVLIGSLTAALLVHLLRCHSTAINVDRRPQPDVAHAALRRALSYIEDRPSGRITLDELADVAGISRFHFCRLFREHIGVSPARYVERSRLELAKRMIRAGGCSLADIAHAVGFADQSHFTRRFRLCEGRTPADYARENGKRPLRSEAK